MWLEVRGLGRWMLHEKTMKGAAWLCDAGFGGVNSIATLSTAMCCAMALWQKGSAMVYDTRALKPLHELAKLDKLAPKDRREYEKMLEKAADEILWKAQHPWKALLWKICDWIESL